MSHVKAPLSVELVQSGEDDRESWAIVRSDPGASWEAINAALPADLGEVRHETTLRFSAEDGISYDGWVLRQL